MQASHDLERLQQPDALPVVEGSRASSVLIENLGKTPAAKAPSGASKAPAKGKNTTAQPSTSGGGQFVVSDKGVYFKSGEDDPPVWVCAWLEILARTRDKEGGNWGLLVAFKDPDGKLKEINLSAEALTSDGGGDTVRRLAGHGLQLASGLKGKQRLLDYLQRATPIQRALLVEKAGWHQGVFVLGDESIGESAERLVFHSSQAPAPYAQAGSLAQWRDKLASLCPGNDRLLFAVALAFAGPLLYLTGAENGGFHLVGDSSQGKSSITFAASSVWGKASEYYKTWRATDNSMEGIARAYSDNLLPLDELKQCSAHVVDEVVYMLGNGKAKGRATDSGGLRKPASWRVLLLSTGEITLQQHLASVGKQSFAGLEVRLLNIPIEASLFPCLHHFEDGAALSNYIRAMADSHYGCAGRAFLQRLTQDPEAASQQAKTLMRAFMDQQVPSGAHGQISRAAWRFALVAAAGELATAWGITGWGEGLAMKAAADAFGAWLAGRGTTGSLEERDIVRRLAWFLEQHGEARFSRLTDEMTSDPDNHKPKTLARCGYRKLEKAPASDVPRYSSTETEEQKAAAEAVQVVYFVFSEAWKGEVFKGLSARLANKVLTALGVLQVGKDGKSSRSPNSVGLHKVESPGRVYVVDAQRLATVMGEQE